MMLTEVTEVPQAALPVQIFKDHLRLGTGFADDGVQDGLVESHLRAAMAAIEARIGKALLARQFKLVLEDWRDAAAQALPVAPVSAVASVTLVDAAGGMQVVAPARYRVQADRHRPRLVGVGMALPMEPVDGQVEIVFTAGFGAGCSAVSWQGGGGRHLFGRNYDFDRLAQGLSRALWGFYKKFVLANDLGTDRLYVYDYAADANSPLRLKDTVPTKTGGGPRHLAFSPNGLHVYLLHELDGALTVFNYKNGTLRRIQETSVVPAGFSGSTSAADLHLSADGKFLYATNRGDANTISVFSVDARGKLAHQQTLSSGGKGPRNFAIDPTGKYVLVAHQYSNDIIVFKRDQTTGLLENTGKKLELCAPVCLVFAP